MVHDVRGDEINRIKGKKGKTKREEEEEEEEEEIT